MTQDAKVYDPFALATTDENVPRIQGPDGKQFVLLADITASQEQRVRETLNRLHGLDDSATIDESVDAAIAMISSSVIESDELTAWLRSMWKDDKLGLKQLRGMVDFVNDWLEADVDPEG